MNFFQNISLRRKQTLIMMLTSSVTLLLACAAFVAYDTLRFRKELAQQVSTMANVIGNNCTAALDFNDPKSAGETLTALSAEPNIVIACIYDRHGDLFAFYKRDGKDSMAVLPLVKIAGHGFEGDELRLYQPIVVRGETLGTIYLAHDLRQLDQLMKSYAGIVTLVFGVSLLVAFGLSSRLQRLVSNPILHLAKVARTVAQEENYSLRAKKQSNDEIGQLVDGFNEMLMQIQQRDGALQAAQVHLEKRVADRTAELAESLSQLNATLGSTADGILVVNNNGKIIIQNQRTIDLWKIPPHLTNNQDDDAQVEHVLKLTANPEEFLKGVRYFYSHPDLGGEDEITLTDGTIMQRITAPVLGKDGKNYGRIWTFRDVTENKKNEASLRELQALYHSLVDQMPAGVFRKDADGRFVFVNSWFCRFKKMEPDHILGRTTLEITEDEQKNPAAKWLPELAPEGVTHHALIMQTGQIIEVEEKYPDVDGKNKYLRAVKSPVFDSGGKITGSQGILFDVTAVKEAEFELAYERDLLRSLLDSSPDQIYFKDIQSRFLKVSKAQANNFGLEDMGELAGKTDFDFFAEEHARPAFEDEQEIIRTGKPLIGRIEKEVWKDGHVTWVLTNKIPLRDKDGQIIGTFGISKDITVIKAAEAELAYQRDLLETLMNHSPDSIFFKDSRSCFVRISRSQTAHLLRVALSHYRTMHPADEKNALPPHLASVEEFEKFAIGKSDADIYGSEQAESFSADENEIMRTGKSIIGKNEHTVFPDGSNVWYTTTKVAWRNQDGKIIGTLGASREISDLKNAETRLEQVHKQLMETSRKAGMSEVASNVLHNVGNVLNSVNVSASLLADSARKSKASSLAKVAALLKEHTHDLGTFFTSDPRGKQLPPFLFQLSEHFLEHQKGTIKELDSLRSNIEHIKEIVAMQQSYAKVSGIKEIISINELVEDSLRMNEAALSRHGVKVIREFENLPPMNVEKHKILQILVNLIRNSKHACQDSERADKRLTVRVSNGDDHVKISVSDNGVGIPPENLTRIFSHGFTTKKEGHGFGLHSGALAAKEMGGALTVQSDGLGCGATFVLELPIEYHSTRRTTSLGDAI